MPGHANGLLPLKATGATFCADSQMYSDTAGKTNEVLIKLIQEYAQLFGSQTFHLGCDETTVKPPLCTLEATKAVEVAVSEAVHSLKNNGEAMWPMGWEEFHWRTNASSAVGGGPTGAIIEAWSRYKAADVVKAGYRAVEADGSRFYLNHLHPTEAQWLDIGVGIETEAEKQLMLGGEIAMWTLEYRAPCGVHPPDHQCGTNLFAPSTDATFSKSFGGIVWPRYDHFHTALTRCWITQCSACVFCCLSRQITDRLFVYFVALLRCTVPRSTAVGAASFWNYNSSWSFDGLTDRYLGFAAVLEARGLFTCPANCTLVKTANSNVGCDYNYACGKRYS